MLAPKYPSEDSVRSDFKSPKVVACLIRSQEGAGKTSFWEWFGKYVLGQKYYLPPRMGRVVKKLNSIAAK